MSNNNSSSDVPEKRILLFLNEKLAVKFICPICKEFYEDPIRLPCSHIFCYKCQIKINKVSYFDMSSEEKYKCPCTNCNISYQTNLLVSEKQYNRIFPNMKVYCKNFENGCDWRGSYKDLDEHEDSCNFVVNNLDDEDKHIIKCMAELYKENFETEREDYLKGYLIRSQSNLETSRLYFTIPNGISQNDIENQQNNSSQEFSQLISEMDSIQLQFSSLNGTQNNILPDENIHNSQNNNIVNLNDQAFTPQKSNQKNPNLHESNAELYVIKEQESNMGSINKGENFSTIQNSNKNPLNQSQNLILNQNDSYVTLGPNTQKPLKVESQFDSPQKKNSRISQSEQNLVDKKVCKEHHNGQEYNCINDQNYGCEYLCSKCNDFHLESYNEMCKRQWNKQNQQFVSPPRAFNPYCISEVNSLYKKDDEKSPREDRTFTELLNGNQTENQASRDMLQRYQEGRQRRNIERAPLDSLKPIFKQEDGNNETKTVYLTQNYKGIFAQDYENDTKQHPENNNKDPNLNLNNRHQIDLNSHQEFNPQNNLLTNSNNQLTINVNLQQSVNQKNNFCLNENNQPQIKNTQQNNLDINSNNQATVNSQENNTNDHNNKNSKKDYGKNKKVERKIILRKDIKGVKSNVKKKN